MDNLRARNAAVMTMKKNRRRLFSNCVAIDVSEGDEGKEEGAKETKEVHYCRTGMSLPGPPVGCA